MKNIARLLVAGAILTTLTTAWAAGVKPAGTVLAEAETLAAQQHKNVLLTFHASWCGWCKKLDALLGSDEFKKSFDDSFVIVHITVLESKDKKADENPGGEELLEKLGGKDQGIPFFAVYNPQGKLLAVSLHKDEKGKMVNIGYPAEPGEVQSFMSMMEKGAPNMSKTDRDRLRTYLSIPKGG